MSYKRLTRIVKSWTGKGEPLNRYYSFEEAKLIVNDLALDLKPETLDKIISSDEILDEFLGYIYTIEKKINKSIVNNLGVIAEEFEPKAYEEGNMVAFSLNHKGKEVVFAEFDLRNYSS